MIPHVPPPPPADPFAAYGGYVLRVDPLTQYGGFSLPASGPYTVQFPAKMQELFRPHRYKVLKGGRGSAKSWSVGRALIIQSLMGRKRILCAREFQTTIADSVHKLLSDQIDAMGLRPWFNITKNHIRCLATGSEFLFIGLGDLARPSNRAKIKSFEAVDIVWIEEAETISDTTWEVLIPTIRKPGSEIWIVYNPNLATDATYKRFDTNFESLKDAVRIEINWNENPWLSQELIDEKDYLYSVDPEAAEHVWGGKLKQHAEATIFRGKYVVENFDLPENPRWLHGVDWGFSQDPLVMVRAFMTTVTAADVALSKTLTLEDIGEHLWVEKETWGIGVEIDEMVAPEPGGRLPSGRAAAFEKILTYRQWPVKADSARPELISYVKNKGINIKAAEKWPGSVEDGIAHLRGFRKIHIHKTNCPHFADEASLYRYEVDKVTREILPTPIDKHNHCWDALRYALDGYIQRRGSTGKWAKLARG